MKKMIAILLIIISFTSILPEKAYATSTWYFVVTAYYSPLPNQSAYIMWSYEAEIRMNGEGIAGASWKPVFSWMLAAPQSYSFWTKIYLEWLGIWEVADRWGAIVAKWERWFKHDRIDVWMGYWEEGLRRAMYWWNRTVKWYVTKRNSGVTINTKNHPAPVWATAWLKKVFTTPTIYNIGIWLHSDHWTVKKLQELLRDNGFYAGELNGDYKTIMWIIFSFQKENNLVINENTFWAWYWGKLTRALFLKKSLNGTLNASQTQLIPSSALLDEKKAEAANNIEVINIFEKALTTEWEFKKLQEVLKEIGLYEWLIDGKYESIKELILQYQLGKQLISDTHSIWAGIYWPKTRASLKKDYEYFISEKEKWEERKREMEKRKKELEEKFQELEEIAEESVESKISHIWILKQWDISPAVRDLQNIMKELWYFDHKDTAIYWIKTEESVFNYQIDRWLISSREDIWAWVCGPVTKWQIQKDLKANVLESLLFENKLSSEELIKHGIMNF